jgi:hypothetical protein
VIDLCLTCIWEQPALTEKIAKYLRNWTEQKKVADALDKALFGDGELFDTQYLSLIPLFRQSSAINEKHCSKFLRIGRRNDLHWAARAEAFLSLMLFPLQENHFKMLRKIYDRESSPYVKKVILAVFQKAQFGVKQSMLRATITEPEEETNRFRKYLWSLVNNPEHSTRALKVISKTEQDPARLLVCLYCSVQSEDANTLRQVKQTADKHSKLAASVLLERAFIQVFKRAEARIEFLKKQKDLRDSK